MTRVSTKIPLNDDYESTNIDKDADKNEQKKIQSTCLAKLYGHSLTQKHDDLKSVDHYGTTRSQKI